MKMRSVLAMLPFFAALAQEKKSESKEAAIPFYFPHRSKFKGYMRDNRNWGRKR
jgi:hypothetical protein